MNFLTPGTIALAGALTIPPLVALYFLKLKRQKYAISSTLLWKKAIEDLHVNSPFQRLRTSLLLLLQLLVLALAALALGHPMMAIERDREKSLILIIDQSASMAVAEENQLTRLDLAKREAKRVVDSMDENSRAMVIAFCDRATVPSSYDNDKDALKRKIDSIEQTDSTSMLSEAINLAEAYSQNIIIGTSSGNDVAPEASASATVMLFTDGRVADANDVSPQRLDLTNMEIVRIGSRSDNVGIITMDALRNYERPEMLQVFATARNFSDKPVTIDATLYFDGEHMDVQTVELAPGMIPAADDDSTPSDDDNAGVPLPGSVASIAFDEIEFASAGVAEIRLNTQDALRADDKAFAIIPPSRRVNLLLVVDDNRKLVDLLSILNIDLTIMSPDEYENAPDDVLADGSRSRFDVVMFDNHSTDRLPTGNYFFWGGAPIIDGVAETGLVRDEVFIDWDDTHPILRHTDVSAIEIFDHWKRINLPPEAIILIEGSSEHSNVLSLLSRDGSQFLICAFGLLATDDQGESVLNTAWMLHWSFPLFTVDTIDFLASTLSAKALSSLRPGQPQMVPIPPNTDTVIVLRPDGKQDRLPTAGAQKITYARTRRVGIYTISPGVEGGDRIAVNLLDVNESRVNPKTTFEIGSSPIATTTGENLVDEPLWPWLVLGLLVICLIEWIVYNRRVFV